MMNYYYYSLYQSFTRCDFSIMMNYYYYSSSLNSSSLSLSSSISSSSHPTIPPLNPPQWLFHFHHPKIQTHHPTAPSISCSFRRHHRRHTRRRRLNPNPNPTQSEPSSTSSNSKLQMTIDVEDVSNKASMSLQRFLASSELRLNQFLQSGDEALRDLQTLITFDGDRKVVISCQRSTLEFMANLVLLGCVIAFAFRVLVKLGLGFRDRLGIGYGGGVIRRRDRSLGGREVVIGRSQKKMGDDVRVLKNPNIPFQETVGRVSEALPKSWARRGENRLPSWWPMSPSPPVVTVNNQEYEREANRLIRAIMDNRMGGRDIVEDDIIQLRRICRTSGVRVYIDTANARDSIYRASVNYVLSHCSSMAGHSTFGQIDGEDTRQFITGLADNIGIENIHAARIVSAAVAARTRSCFLQAWALEMQGKHFEAAVELSKICLMHQIFPPEECSPEMEMVARGLEKHLKVEQREFLMNMLVRVCGEESRRSATEALGLMRKEDVRDQQESKYT